MKYCKSFFRVLSLLLLIVVSSCNTEPFGGEVPEKEIETETELSCVDAAQNTITATTNFSTAVSTDSNYTELCNAYKKALEDQVFACGDEGGIMQSLIDGLDCSSDEELNDCDKAIQTSSEAQTALANSGNENYASLCAAYKVALQNQINVCGDTDGNLQIIVDGLGSCEESLITNCDDAIAATAIAQGLLSSATNENYATLCNAYKIALSSQIDLCGDTDDSLQNIIDGLGNCISSDSVSSGCDGNIMIDFFGPVACDYGKYSNLSIVNVYVNESFDLYDVDNDDITDHYSKILYITDGTVVIDSDNKITSVVNNTYLLEFVIKFLGTDGSIGLVPGVYKHVNAPSVNTLSESYISDGFFGDVGCDEFGLLCDERFATWNGVMSLSESNGVYDLCFDALLDWDDNCFKGNYSGEIKVVDY